MKRYIRSANKLTNAITQRVSQKFNENEILVRALAGEHKGEPMMYVFFNIMLDPHVHIEDPERLEGNHTIFYDGKNIGWINFERGMGWIDDKAYNKIQKLDPAILDQLIAQWFSQFGLGAGAPQGFDGPQIGDGREMWGPGFDDYDGPDFGSEDSGYWS